jgi:hypothetical protein
MNFLRVLEQITMKSFKSAVLAALFGFCSSSIKAEITSVSTMKEVQIILQTVLQKYKPEDILAAFDIDMTLLRFEHSAVCYPTLKKYSDIYKDLLGQLSREQKDIVSTLLVYDIPLKLVEEGTPRIITQFQDEGIKVIAFTATLTGPFSTKYNDTISLRAEQLKQSGLNIPKSFAGLNSQVFSDFSQYVGSYPMFYQGVLSSNGEGSATKGEVLVAFLKVLGQDSQQKTGQMGFTPKVIIMIDDRKKHLIDVEEKLKAFNPSIQFIGIEYQGAFAYVPQDISRKEFQKFWENRIEEARAKVF